LQALFSLHDRRWSGTKGARHHRADHAPWPRRRSHRV